MFFSSPICHDVAIYHHRHLARHAHCQSVLVLTVLRVDLASLGFMTRESNREQDTSCDSIECFLNDFAELRQCWTWCTVHLQIVLPNCIMFPPGNIVSRYLS
jgi:hypothetical protein